MSSYEGYYKEYYHKNKEKILSKRPRTEAGSTYTEYFRDYYMINREKILQKRREKYKQMKLDYEKTKLSEGQK